MPKQPKVIETNSSQVEHKLDLVLEALKDLKEAFNKPITSQAPSLMENRQLPKEQPKAPEPINTIPIPAEFRQQVDSVLNKDFGIEIEGTGDPLSMLFTIVIPDKFSRLSLSQKEASMRDISPKVIDRALGINGIKEWCDKVYSTFAPEIQAQIVADRSNH